MARRLLWRQLLLAAIVISIALASPTLTDGAQSQGIAKCESSSSQIPLASNQSAPGDTFPASGIRYEAFNNSSARRRRLGDFRECAPCTCCTDQTRKYCFLTGCCYNINCSLRRVPFGLCSFTPVSCNCFGCS
ncbi:uncharacterized protein LOC9645444 [Selaginella moellendorffii]|uniref:uncharacterized protein LOC9645444 n=1 Tax=Selaginella moellendorffii TaxID=88036 RepID=UPI000D1C4E13|nr:uncharacterized protein LOC9645444 [Selaginella moellendorffii]|eukprot:XP_024536518.1 uncharacterized protein LOC9645444 [Selaginella moellendorffii]